MKVEKENQLPKMFSTSMSCLLLALLLTSQADGLRILGLFSLPAVSHFYFFRPILRGLAEAGHNVTVVSYYPDLSANYTDLPLLADETLITMDVSVSDLLHYNRLGASHCSSLSRSIQCDGPTNRYLHFSMNSETTA